MLHDHVAEIPGDRNELEVTVVVDERDAGPLRADGVERVVDECLRGDGRIGRCGHRGDRVLQVRDARECPLALGRVDDDATDGRATAVWIVEAEEADFRPLRLAGDLMRPHERNPVDGLAAREDLLDDRFELVGEVGTHLAQRLADVFRDRVAVQLGQVLVDCEVAQLGVECGEPDRAGASEPM